MKAYNVLAMISPMSYERVSGIARYAKEHGWNLIMQDRLGRKPLAWNGDGVIITLRNDPHSSRTVASMMRRGIAVVDLAVTRPDVKVPRVVSDHREIGRLAAGHFLEREFRHTAWFSSAWGNVHDLRFDGFCNALPHRPERWVLSEELPKHRQGDWQSFVNWLAAKMAKSNRPMAVLTYDETDAARLLYGATALGISIPEELAILSIGNNPLVCENQSIPLSSIDQNLEHGGYEAAALLDKLMRSRGKRGNVSTTRTILIPPAGIVTRQSTDVIAVSDPHLRRAMEFIKKNLGKPIGSPQIAEALSLPRCKLDQLFRANLFRSVGDEIRRQRLATAKLLLKDSSLPISAIAGQTGYCTPSHLTNAFKSAFGMTPRAWRISR